MNKLKVSFAESFNGMIHDIYEWYANTIPFCDKGIAEWCESVPLDEAEIVHAGQVGEQAAIPFLLPSTTLPIVVDIEGDRAYDNFRPDLGDAVRVCCGAPLEWRGTRSFARPTMSRFLVHAAREIHAKFPKAIYNSLGFIGKTDSRGIRQKMARASAGLPASICLQQDWHGPSELNHPARSSFAHSMIGCGSALCPMGEGVATSRFYEACFYGRHPVVIGETMVLGDGYVDLGFVTQIDARLTEAAMREALVEVCEMPLSEVQDRGKAAQAYFETTVREYFADPTLAFIKWFRSDRL